MKKKLAICFKKQQQITLTTKDDWIVDVEEVHYHKVFHECQIIMSDFAKYIRRRKEEGYSCLIRNK